MPTVSEVIVMLEKRFKNKLEDSIAIGIWTSKDIKTIANDNGIDLKGDDVKDILDILTEDFDPSIGISEDVIKETLDEANPLSYGDATGYFDNDFSEKEDVYDEDRDGRDFGDTENDDEE